MRDLLILATLFAFAIDWAVAATLRMKFGRTARYLKYEVYSCIGGAVVLWSWLFLGDIESTWVRALIGFYSGCLAIGASHAINGIREEKGDKDAGTVNIYLGGGE